MQREQWQNVFNKVQSNSSCHQKYIRILVGWFKQMPFDQFVNLFMGFLQISFHWNTDGGVYVKRVFNFVSLFCIEVSRKEDENQKFISRVLRKALRLSRSCHFHVRYNCCCFISKLLQAVGDDFQLEIDLIDDIQKVILERVQEPKISMRLQALAVLLRLQDPLNKDCPVVATYVEALSSANASVRREATKGIAPTAQTLSLIKDRLRDVDASVRAAAFHKCADVGPNNFRIAEKHKILVCGFKETEQKVKREFYDYLLPKWLTAYDGKVLNFLKALKLIADEDDLTKMTYLAQELVKEFYKTHPINDLIGELPLNEGIVVDVENLSTRVSLLWSHLVQLLRESKDMEEQLDSIIPDLTPFCTYLEKLIEKKSAEAMDEWKCFEYQFDLLNLLDIARNYDFADEMGRRTIRSLTVNVLQKYTFLPKVTKKLVSILAKCSSNVEFFTNDVCQIVSDIQESFVEKPLSQDQIRERNFKLAELKVKLNILREQQNEATSNREYERAQIISDELDATEQQLNNFHDDVEKVRVTKSDNDTFCRCLDIMIGVLEEPSVSELTPSLDTWKSSFLTPLISSQCGEVHWRVLRCLALMSIIDKATAEQYGKIICIPIATYRTIPINNVQALVQSIYGTADLIVVHGVEVIGGSEENDTANCTNQNSKRRRLYTTVCDADVTNVSCDMTLTCVVDIYLDLMDDERDEIRCRAVDALINLVKWSSSMTSSVLPRIILKWFNPLTERHDFGMQARLGVLIEVAMKSKNFGECVKDAVVPVLSSVANAPRMSPLVDVDMDNLLLFLAEMVNISLTTDDIRIFVLDVCMKISDNPTERVVPFLVKILGHLNVDKHTNEAMSEMIDRAELLKEVIVEKTIKKHVEKLVTKLRMSLETSAGQTATSSLSIATNGVSEVSSNNVTRSTGYDTSKTISSEKTNGTPQTKRRKRRSIRECVVVLERFDQHHTATLDPIIESRVEAMNLDDNMEVNAPSTDSENNQEMTRNRENVLVVSETSDSDFSNSVSIGESRVRKKRIL